MKKKILLLGICDSTYIVHFINDVLLPNEFDVYVRVDSNKLNNSLPDDKRVHVVKCLKYRAAKNKIISGIVNKVRFYINTIKLKSISNLSFIHIHLVGYYAVKEALRIKSKNTKLLATYWGSDILRASKKELQFIGNRLDSFDYITSDALVTKEAFLQQYGGKYNIAVIYFGDSIIENNLQVFEKNIFDVRNELGISAEKKVVTVGYNARPAQQHDKIIDVIKELPEEIRAKYQFVFPLTYCVEDSAYLLKIKSQLEKSDFDYVILEEYMSDEDVAKLRFCTDIFINSQTTDAFCNTVKEYFYLGKTVINPEWLHYKELDDLGLDFVEYKQFTDLVTILTDLETFVLDYEKNSRIMKNQLSWYSCCKNWNLVYTQLDK